MNLIKEILWIGILLLMLEGCCCESPSIKETNCEYPKVIVDDDTSSLTTAPRISGYNKGNRPVSTLEELVSAYYVQYLRVSEGIEALGSYKIIFKNGKCLFFFHDQCIGTFRCELDKGRLEIFWPPELDCMVSFLSYKFTHEYEHPIDGEPFGEFILASDSTLIFNSYDSERLMLLNTGCGEEYTNCDTLFPTVFKYNFSRLIE